MTIIEADGFQIACEDDIETWRAKTFATKEPGTLRWLATARPGDVVYDVGANIGLYTLVAARAVGPLGRVYAFEPHAANLVSLLRNVAINQFNDRVTILASALGAVHGLATFNYAQLRSGSSGSQLGHAVAESGEAFTPLAAELKHVATIDGLLKGRHLRPANLVKIDVDGNEPAVLAGMSRFLGGLLPPRSVQVEARAATHAEIATLMTGAGYRLQERHDTAWGAEQIEKGTPPATLAYNLVFERAA